jgi:ABC-2 type transport system ATP-binding protein
MGENESPNELLSLLTNYGEVEHFLELVPSANDIFIQAVRKNN